MNYFVCDYSTLISKVRYSTTASIEGGGGWIGEVEVSSFFLKINDVCRVPAIISLAMLIPVLPEIITSLTHFVSHYYNFYHDDSQNGSTFEKKRKSLHRLPVHVHYTGFPTYHSSDSILLETELQVHITIKNMCVKIHVHKPRNFGTNILVWVGKRTRIGRHLGNLYYKWVKPLSSNSKSTGTNRIPAL